MRLKIQEFFNCFVLFLPFTQALTINVFFPLKISELLLFVLFFITIQLKFDKNYFLILRRFKIILLFLLIVTLSFIVNIFWEYDYNLKNIPFRIGRVSDSLLRLFYIYLNVSAFFISIYFIAKDIRSLNFWVKGAVLASIYAWYIFISSAFDLPYIKLFGMEKNPQNIMGIVRAGTFKEGNFFSLFLVLSCSIAFYLNKIKSAWFFVITIITTLSTIGIISVLLFLIIYFKRRIFKTRNLKILFLISPLIIFSSIYFFQSQFYDKYIYEKIFTPVENLTPSNLSKVDRYLTGDIAYKEGLNNPFFGVGPNNFSLHYDFYNDIENIVHNNTDWSLDYFNRIGRKAIPNNVYLEVWAEYGILGFLIFIFFLISVVWSTIRIKSLALTGGLAAMLLGLNAFPSFIMLFLWVYMAIPYAIIFSKRMKSNIK